MGMEPARLPRRKSLARESLETILGAVSLALFIMVFVARAFTVDGPSMLPTLQSGERLLIDKVTYRLRSPERGEILVFRYPADPSHYFIKRVIGLPGDEVRLAGGRVFVNGQPLNESYINGPIRGRDRTYRVPEGSYFVLGDNRNNSQDSRSAAVGFVPRSAIVGRAVVRFWPLERAGLLMPQQTAKASP